MCDKGTLLASIYCALVVKHHVQQIVQQIHNKSACQDVEQLVRLVVNTFTTNRSSGVWAACTRAIN